MSGQQPITIVVAGGGTAGWMTAAAFAHLLGGDGTRGFRVMLIESDAIGTIGVGEATIPQIRLFNQTLGIDEATFMKATQATYKLAIEFVGWRRPGERYMHAFGDVGRDSGAIAFHQMWLRGRREGVAGDLARYSLNNLAALSDRMQSGAARTSRALPEMPYAYHFDATLYARFLRDFAQARGATRIEGTIAAVERDGEGIAALRMASGARIAGDLFIDCTGFRGLLIEETLDAGYEDWTHLLPCDRAIAVPSTRVEAFTPYTRATAHRAGWQWRIPLQHRTGNGVVYASRHMSEDEATATLLAGLDSTPLAEPRALRFTTGKRRAMWKANVIAVGLASGFMEPLESTSIHLIQTAIARILKLMPGAHTTQADRDEYNRQSDFEYERVRDFLVLHYLANARDEPFWRECRERDVPGALAHKLALWRGNGHLTREREELFTEVAWFQVLAGQGIVPEGGHPMAAALPHADLKEYLDIIAQLTAREVAQMPSHADFVARHCAAGVPVAA